jgi:hypothetical protein
MSQENIIMVGKIYAAFAMGDVQTVFASFAPEIEWQAAENSPAAKGSPYHGLDEVREGVFMLIGNEFPRLEMRLDELLDAGDKVVALGAYIGSRKSTGKPFLAQFAHVWTIAAGKVAKFQQYTDTYQFAETAK